MTVASSPSVSVELTHQIERFLHQEAKLLDERRYREWLDLLTEDITYVVPSRFNRLPAGKDEDWDPAKEIDTLALVEEDYTSLRLKIERLFLGSAWAELPPSRTRHLITNVLVETTEHANEYRVESNFLAYRSRLQGRKGEDEDFLVGSRVDLIRQVEPGVFRVAARTAILDSVVLNTHNLSFFL